MHSTDLAHTIQVIQDHICFFFRFSEHSVFNNSPKLWPKLHINGPNHRAYKGLFVFCITPKLQRWLSILMDNQDRLKWLIDRAKIIPAWTTNLRQSLWDLSAAIPWKGSSHLCPMLSQAVWTLPLIVWPSFTIIDNVVSVRCPARSSNPYNSFLRILIDGSLKWLLNWGVGDRHLLHLPPRCRGWIFAKDFKNNNHQFEVSSSAFSIGCFPLPVFVPGTMWDQCQYIE